MNYVQAAFKEKGNVSDLKWLHACKFTLGTQFERKELSKEGAQNFKIQFKTMNKNNSSQLHKPLNSKYCSTKMCHGMLWFERFPTKTERDEKQHSSVCFLYANFKIG